MAWPGARRTYEAASQVGPFSPPPIDRTDTRPAGYAQVLANAAFGQPMFGLLEPVGWLPSPSRLGELRLGGTPLGRSRAVIYGSFLRDMHLMPDTIGQRRMYVVPETGDRIEHRQTAGGFAVGSGAAGHMRPYHGRLTKVSVTYTETPDLGMHP